MLDTVPMTPTLAMLPSTPGTRLLIELASYAEDLSEAGEALELAFEAGPGSSCWLPLTNAAVVAYMRAFGRSDARGDLAAHIELPEDLHETHAMIRDYRNRSVAHSQSGLSMSLALAHLGTDGRVATVRAMTVRHALPAHTATRVADAVERIEAMLAERIQTLSDALAAEFREVSAHTVAAWTSPIIEHRLAEQFSGRSRRGSRPQFTMYWETEDISPADAETPHE
ncbi:hypothetical protein [Agromyces rhizosphaerae]|nr:hypothetical protein [Agromyces rhizosphaerae]